MPRTDLLFRKKLLELDALGLRSLARLLRLKQSLPQPIDLLVELRFRCCPLA